MNESNAQPTHVWHSTKANDYFSSRLPSILVKQNFIFFLSLLYLDCFFLLYSKEFPNNHTIFFFFVYLLNFYFLFSNIFFITKYWNNFLSIETNFCRTNLFIFIFWYDCIGNTDCIWTHMKHHSMLLSCWPKGLRSNSKISQMIKKKNQNKKKNQTNAIRNMYKIKTYTKNAKPSQINSARKKKLVTNATTSVQNSISIEFVGTWRQGWTAYMWAKQHQVQINIAPTTTSAHVLESFATVSTSRAMHEWWHATTTANVMWLPDENSKILMARPKRTTFLFFFSIQSNQKYYNVSCLL